MRRKEIKTEKGDAVKETIHRILANRQVRNQTKKRGHVWI